VVYAKFPEGQTRRFLLYVAQKEGLGGNKALHRGVDMGKA